MQFDAREAKLLKPGEHIIVEGCPGLRLVATATRRTWIYRYKSPHDGRMRQIAIGRWPKTSPAAAATAWEGLRDRRDGGADPAVEKRAKARARPEPKDAGYSVQDLVDDYLVGHIDRHRKPKGAAETRRLFDKLLGDLGQLQAVDVTRRIAFDFVDGLAHIPVTAGYMRRELGAAWDYALDAGRISEDTPNWWRQVMRGRLHSTGKRIEGKSVGAGKRVLSLDELQRVIGWLPNFSQAVADVLTLYIWTGTRGAEIVAIEAQEISDEPDGLWWTCPKAKTKNARHPDATDLRVPLVGRAEEVVRRRLGEVKKGYLFPSRKPGEHVEQKVASVAVHYHQPYSRTKGSQPNRPRLPVTHWAPHDLRRSVRTQLAALGCPDEVAEAVLGHMAPGVRGTYNLHKYDKERRQWLTKLSRRLESRR